MAIRDRKVHKKRGHRTSGWGGAQKHRGAGHRGGRGMAGSRKHRWVWVSKFDPNRFLSIGFKRPKSILHRDRVINAGLINEKIKALSEEGIAKEENGKFNINLRAMGYNKLLGAGVVDKPLIVTVDSCSEAAKKKVEDAGGKVITPDAEFESAKSEAVLEEEEVIEEASE